MKTIEHQLTDSITHERGKKALEHVRKLLNVIEGVFDNNSDVFSDEDLEDVEACVKELGLDHRSLTQSIREKRGDGLPWPVKSVKEIDDESKTLFI